jgi:hypothetical protein
VDGVTGRVGDVAWPEILDQAFDARRLISIEEQACQDRSLAARAQIERDLIQEHLERPENPDIHASLALHP